LATRLTEHGLRVVSGGTDNHLFLVDVTGAGHTGKTAEKALERAGITVNKNTIPFDPNPPLVASGVRFGTPAVTTRGMAEREMDEIARFIVQALSPAAAAESIRDEVRRLCSDFPLYEET
jgi:glycine hydroxymethyltransferase